MSMGNLRKDIVEKCPEEFEGDLKTFIDAVETKVNEVKDLLNVSSLADLGNLDVAYNQLDDLSAGLY